MQIHSEAEKFGRNANIRSACIYGGVEKYPQQKELQRGVHLVIACPGRLLDFLEMGVVNLRRVTYLVLDEADRMLVRMDENYFEYIIRIWVLSLKFEGF
jgi:Superfamily II DNA and RNA helicases